MNKEKTILRIKETGIFAVVRVETIERGLEIAEGCLKGGVDVMEISYTNNNAGEVIKAIKEKFGDKICIGAGTVLDPTTARLAIMNGAEFVIAPDYDRPTLEMCNLYQIPYGGGCTTYTEMIEALKAGASFIKAFPISNYYGPSLAKTFKVPCPQLPLMASGNVTLDNIGEWVKNGIDCMGVGTLLTKGTKEQIAENAKKLTDLFKTAKGK